jgi:hypothetical protein
MTDLEKLTILGKKSQENIKKFFKDIADGAKELSAALNEEKTETEEEEQE